MSEKADTSAEAARIDALYRAKARAEVDVAEALVPGANVVRGQGDLLADVLLVKGEPGAGDMAKKRALAGDDGAAIGKALDALGLSSHRFALCTRVATSKTARRSQAQPAPRSRNRKSARGSTMLEPSRSPPQASLSAAPPAVRA